MTRFEFLKKAGFSGGALMAVLASCVKVEDTYVEALVQSPNTQATNTGTTPTTNTGTTPVTNTGTTPVTNTGATTSNADAKYLISTADLNKITNFKLKLDLSNSAYSKIKIRENYIIDSSIVVALSKTGQYLAATVTCSHEPKKQMIYSSGEWYCTAHGARFAESGAGLNSNGKKGLTVYKVASDGKTVIVY